MLVAGTWTRSNHDAPMKPGHPQLRVIALTHLVYTATPLDEVRLNSSIQRPDIRRVQEPGLAVASCHKPIGTSIFNRHGSDAQRRGNQPGPRRPDSRAVISNRSGESRQNTQS